MDFDLFVADENGIANTTFSYFNPSPESVKIGRQNTCEICIEDNTLSKNQAHMNYVPMKGWQLVDGFEGKQSTNGTWLYVSEDFEIYDGLVFKAHQMLFKVSVIMPTGD